MTFQKHFDVPVLLQPVFLLQNMNLSDFDSSQLSLPAINTAFLAIMKVFHLALVLAVILPVDSPFKKLMVKLH
jgi:hypothetical protein